VGDRCVGHGCSSGRRGVARERLSQAAHPL